MARLDPSDATPKPDDRAADGSMAMRRFQGDQAMQPLREAGVAGLHTRFDRVPEWTDPRPHDAQDQKG